MRDWIALYPSILRSRKWRVLSDPERLAWLVLLLEAAHSIPEGEIEDFDTGAYLLQRNGVGEDYTRNEIMARLVEAGVFDVDLDQGPTLRVRGWSTYQRTYRGPSDEPTLKAALERERYWRQKAEALESGSRLGSSGRSGDRGEDSRGEDSRGDSSPLPPSSQTETEDRDSQDRFYELTVLRPWGKASGNWLKTLDADFGTAKVVAAMEEEWAKNPEAKTLISRTEARLARATDRAKRDAPRKPRGTNGVDPEVAARQREALGSMIGKSPGKPPATQEVRDDG